jgi:hypothetical protein
MGLIIKYIDATKKGGIGRFANHSCNPNSEVQKWVVGRRLRMGIFTKQDVVKGEEITFNYNVDRYGCVAAPVGNGTDEIDMTPRSVIVENQIVSVPLVERRRRISVEWVTCLSRVSLHLY